MGLRWADNVVERSTTTTTGAYQLGGVPSSGERPGAQIFVTGIGDTNTVYYRAEEVGGTAWEEGLGTVTDATPDTLARTRIDASSNSNAVVDWTGKTVRIYANLPAYAMRRATLDHAFLLDNAQVVASRSGNAETFALKTAGGNDPSAASPVRIAFRNASDGGFTVREATAALSLTISSGSTLGANNGEPFRVWIVIFDDAGTLRLGAIKCALTNGVFGLQDNVLMSSTAEGGAGAADSAGVIYTGTAVTSKAMRVLGYKEYTLTTAGTWVTAPSIEQAYGHGVRLPGEVVQKQTAYYSTGQSITTVIPWDNTIPQNTEGDQLFTGTITPTSAANLLNILACVNNTKLNAGTNIVALFLDSEANARSAQTYTAAGGDYASNTLVAASLIAASTAQKIFKLRGGNHASGNTMYVNRNSSGSLFGGVMSSYLVMEEIAT